MAKLGPFTQGVLKVSGTDLSTRVEAMTLTLVKDDVDLTAMGDGGHAHQGGLENDKLVVNFWQDLAPGSVDATLLPIFQAGTAVAIKMAGSGTTISSSNPVYTFNGVLTDYQPLGGKVGDGLQAPVTFVVSGTVTEGTSGAW
jgi:hypothetical protein